MYILRMFNTTTYVHCMWIHLDNEGTYLLPVPHVEPLLVEKAPQRLSLDLVDLCGAETEGE